MKSHTRAWIIFIALFCTWGTLPASPFKYFAEMIRELGGYLVIHKFMPVPWQAILLYILIALILITLLLLSKSKNKLYIAGFCALAEMVFHIIYCIRTGKVYPVSLAIAIGLALALLFLLIKARSPALWLSDAFTLSLAVWLVYDGLVFAIEQLPGISLAGLAPFIPVPEASLLTRLDGVLGIPLVAWSALPILLGILPLVFFARGRQKG